MHRGKLIALTGPAGCGKSTAAAVMCEHGFVRYKFAQVLKDMLRAFGLTERQIEGDLKNEPIQELDVTPRYLMQTLGTEWGRDVVNRDLWVILLRKQITEALEQGVNVVVDDCRFPNEAEMIRQLGGRVVLITGRGGIAGDHASEQGVRADYTLVNDGSLEEWRAKVRGVLVDD